MLEVDSTKPPEIILTHNQKLGWGYQYWGAELVLSQVALTGRPVCPPASDPLGSSASPRCRSAVPSSVPPDVLLHSPNEKAALISTDARKAF